MLYDNMLSVVWSKTAVIRSKRETSYHTMQQTATIRRYITDITRQIELHESTARRLCKLRDRYYGILERRGVARMRSYHRREQVNGSLR